MDEKTSVLVCLGAATAVNCVPCFKHYLKKAKGLRLSSEEILEAADLASKVKKMEPIWSCPAESGLSWVMKRLQTRVPALRSKGPAADNFLRVRKWTLLRSTTNSTSG